MSQITDAHKIFGVPKFSDFFGGGIVVWKGEQAPPSHVAMFDGEERRMNHDYAHCLDLKKNCPKSCFRAQLTREVEERDDLKEVPLTWAFLGGSDECPKRKKNHAAD